MRQGISTILGGRISPFKRREEIYSDLALATFAVVFFDESKINSHIISLTDSSPYTTDANSKSTEQWAAVIAILKSGGQCCLSSLQ